MNVDWNPQVDEIINNLDLSEKEIQSILEVAPETFDDPLETPIWYQEIRLLLPKKLQKKLSEISEQVDWGW